MDAKSLAWLLGQWFHFHHSQCVLTPLPVVFCYVLPVTPGTDGSPSLNWNLSGNGWSPAWVLNYQKEYRCSYLCSPSLHFSIIQDLMAYIPAWNTVAWSPKLKLCPFLNSHLYNRASVPFSVLDPYICTRPGPIWYPIGICSVTHICQGTCGMHISVSSHQSPSVRWVQAPYP